MQRHIRSIDIATLKDFKEAQQIIHWHLELHADQTNAAASSLFDDLDLEDEKAKIAKDKKRQKKLKKAAEKNGLTVEELEE